ncbi:NAD(P)-binding protein, partial [Aspergillus indologenus CBS 114.80]
FFCLVNVTQVRPGEIVLIQSSTGGIGQAAITLARQHGAEVLTTVSLQVKTEHKIREYAWPESHILSSRSSRFAQDILCLTNGRGVDVVLNALSGTFPQASLDILAPMGRFLEIGKSDLLGHSRLDMSSLTRAVSFSVVDLGLNASEKPQYMADAFSKVNQMFANLIIRAGAPLVVEPIPGLPRGRELIGELVISHGENDMVKVLPGAPVAAQFHSQATYIAILGGLGGLSRTLSVWLAEHRARHIVALSPCGPDKPRTRGLKRELVQVGAHLHALHYRVEAKAQLHAILAHCRANLPPIRGSIHGGLVPRVRQLSSSPGVHD